MVCLSKRDRQLSLYDLPQGQVRKDFRRPRFSFFRFNCQTAASSGRPEGLQRLGRYSLTTLAAEPVSLRCTIGGGHTRETREGPYRVAASAAAPSMAGV